MTISESVSLVLQAYAIGRKGDILVLDMGTPVRVADLVKTLVRLSGKSGQEFKFIGLRPGEKLFEELFYPEERVFPSTRAKIACTESVRLRLPALKHRLDELYVAVSLGQRASILAHLQQIVPQFTYSGSDQDGSMENVRWRPSASPTLDGARQDVPTLVDLPLLSYPARPTSPVLGPAAGGPGD